jgi:hypothetical protein
MFVSPLNIARRPFAGIAITAALFGLYGVVPASAQTTLTEAQQTAAIVALQNSVASLQSTISSQQTAITNLKNTVNSQASTISALQQKTAPLSLMTDTTRSDKKKNTELYLTGVNVHLVSGSGLTSDNISKGGGLLDLGNLILGYNATGNPHGDVRTGSHNLILGDQNSYSAYGGLVAGFGNSIGGAYASISGGYNGIANGYYASISGGYSGIANGTYASISAGYFNTASGTCAAITGGGYNVVDTNSFASSVSGGNNNEVAGSYSHLP